jgi:hypothetical protein
MSDKTKNNTTSHDSEFHMTLGWLAAAAVSIASWAGLYFAATN